MHTDPGTKSRTSFVRLIYTLATWVASVTCLLPQADLRASAVQDPGLRTVAESSNYTATARPEQVLAFLRRLQQAHALEVRSFGTSAEGRPLVAASAGTGPTVLIVGGIHSGECAGKEAILALLRDLVTRDDAILRRVRIVAIPDFNTDGNARRGKHHRPGQIGPDAGVGWRANAQWLDLNRDFAKLETPEVRALVRLIQDTKPILFVDTHTTDGSVHTHDMLLDIPHHPAVPEVIRRYLRETLIPRVQTKLHQSGFSSNWYGNFDDDQNSWRTFGFGARYSTEYAGLRGIPAVLCEAYSRITYKERVSVTRATLEAILEAAAGDVDDLKRVVAAAREEASALAGNPVPVDGALTTAGKITVRVPRAEGVDERQVDYLGKVEPSVTVTAPHYYAIDGNECRLVHRLMLHGIPVFELHSGAIVAAEELIVEEAEKAERPYQNHRIVRVRVRANEKRVPLKPGTFIVPVSHPLGLLTVALLEPASPDSLVAWNFLDHRLSKGAALPIFRLPGQETLALRRVFGIPRRSRLTLDWIFSPEQRIDFSGRFPPSIEWLQNEGECLIRRDDRLLRLSVPTGALEPYYDEAALAKAWRDAGVQESTAARLAARGWDVLAPAGDAGLVVHDNDLFYVELRPPSVRRLTQDKSREELVEFSPDGKRIAYVKDFNLYVYDLEKNQEIQLTRGGSEESRYGKLDWVYQEELYGRGNYKGFWWSPDGTHLAFLHFDEKGVPKYPVVDHMPVHARIEQDFYPKSGDPLPRVRLGIVAASGGDLRWVDLGNLQVPELLIVRVGFTPDSRRVCFQVQDREQTWLKLCTAQLDGTFDRVILEETSPAWVEVLEEPHWLDDDRFLWLSDRSGNRHVYLVNAATGEIRPVTRGDWEVLQVYGVDSEQQYAFVRGTYESSVRPAIYRVRLTDGTVVPLTKEQGAVTARFSPGFRYFVAYSSEFNFPPRAWFYTADGRRLWALEPNLTDHHLYLQPAVMRSFTVPARDGFPLNCMLILPPEFDPTRRYPVLCYLYGGPQAPVVQNRWTGSRGLWFQMLAQQGIVVFMCDNRASSYRGIKHTWTIHGQMGFQELTDLEDALKWLTSQPWIDRDRMAIHGWSYGGYMTAFALCHSRWFRLGLSGAPVTDWHNYDAIYTERYMRTPSNNPDGYRRTSLVRAAANLHGRLALIHGTIDDNVHVANTLQLVRALQRHNKRFDLMLYPESRHGVRNPDQVLHLYSYMTRLLKEEFFGEN